LWLGLGANELGDKGAECIAELLVCETGQLKSIGLGGNEIHDHGAEILAMALKKNKTLESLGLGGNLIADQGAMEIAEALKYNIKLKKLLLSSNLLGDSGISAIAEALAINKSLEALLIAENPFGNEGGTNLSSVLCQSDCTLRVMDIQNTRMTPDVEKQIVIDLERDSNLERIGSQYAAKLSNEFEYCFSYIFRALTVCAPPL
jgi:Ran GTPase-activating protein (RanGAP) involved in mRNA processing and transport